MGEFDHQSGQFIHIDGADIYYETLGDARKYPVILLHGGMGDLTSFNPLAKYLQDYYLIAIDSRGHGRSTLGSGPLSYQRLQSDVVTVINTLGIKHCAIIGHSDGGTVALRIAAQQETFLDRVIVIGAAGELTDDDPARAIYENINATRWLQIFPQSESLYRQLNAQPDFNCLMNAVRNMWLDQSPTGYPDQTLGNIRCPVFICRGDSDYLLSLAGAQRMVMKIKAARLLNLPGTSHSAHEELPELLYGVFNRFLTEK